MKCTTIFKSEQSTDGRFEFGLSIRDDSDWVLTGAVAPDGFDCLEPGRLDCTGLSYEMADLAFSDLSGVIFTGADLSGADFRGAVLRGTRLRFADLSQADLRGCDLRDADLRCADLRRACLIEADLRGADLSQCEWRGADFRGCFYDLKTVLPFEKDTAEALGLIFRVRV
jgi:uncharacterized protein YjbI with pentapeptide repeats